jgi:hypothetical protein
MLQLDRYENLSREQRWASRIRDLKHKGRIILCLSLNTIRLKPQKILGETKLFAGRAIGLM